MKKNKKMTKKDSENKDEEYLQRRGLGWERRVWISHKLIKKIDFLGTRNIEAKAEKSPVDFFYG